MNTEFISVLEYLEHERGIDKETLIKLVEESLVASASKAVGFTDEVTVKIDRETGDIRAWARLEVARKVVDRERQISLRKARKREPDARPGDVLDWEVTPENFGRIAAQTAKQAIAARLREEEKKGICEEFEDYLNHLLTGVVCRIERGDVYIDFSRAEGVMRYTDRMPGERYQPGDHIIALLIGINSDRPGPSLKVSRADPKLVIRLFEREVAEMNEGLVEIKAIAREAGYRTKIAVVSSDSRVDPVGACVGLRGNRVKTVVRELGGEKVDIIRWDPDIRVFVEQALQPAKLSNVEIHEDSKTIRVVAPEDQLSLAIGKKGQNARLAAKLTNWRIDINKFERPEEKDFEDRVQNAIAMLAKIPGIDEETASVLVHHGFLNVEGLLAADAADIAVLEGIDEERAEGILAAARDTTDG